jgi:hypothetical protein
MVQNLAKVCDKDKSTQKINLININSLHQCSLPENKQPIDWLLTC